MVLQLKNENEKRDESSEQHKFENLLFIYDKTTATEACSLGPKKQIICYVLNV